MKLVYGITVSTEFEEIKTLINFLKNSTKDEIIVQYDNTKNNEEIVNFLNESEVINYGEPFNNDFSLFKNKLTEKCVSYGADYIFQLDADEMLNPFLVSNIKNIIENNKHIDLFFVPRLNTVDGITKEHLKKWNWSQNKDGYINYPDFQGRIFKKECKWFGKIHERILNISKYSFLPEEYEFSLIHKKNIDKQEKQNNFYTNL